MCFGRADLTVCVWGGDHVLGPDNFFGTPIQDLPADRDKAAWAHEALTASIEVFPKWLDAVKEKYGMFSALGNVPFHLAEMLIVVCSAY